MGRAFADLGNINQDCAEFPDVTKPPTAQSLLPGVIGLLSP
jgi:hypothetical protein